MAIHTTNGIVYDQSILTLMGKNDKFQNFILGCLKRVRNGEWGAKYKIRNYIALHSGIGVIRTQYSLDDFTFCIMVDYKNNVTFVWQLIL